MRDVGHSYEEERGLYFAGDYNLRAAGTPKADVDLWFNGNIAVSPSNWCERVTTNLRRLISTIARVGQCRRFAQRFGLRVAALSRI